MTVKKERLDLSDGKTLDYTLVMPDDFAAITPYPTLLALPPGAQDADMVAAGLSYWAQEGQQRGWLIVSAASPDGRLFFKGAEAYIWELLDHISAQYNIEGGRFHVGGISNGGRSAFRLALDKPERFASLLAFPGFPPNQADFQQLARIKHLPMALFVGARDEPWVEKMRRTEAALRKLDADVTLDVVPNEGHVIQSLTGERLFDLLDGWRSRV